MSFVRLRPRIGRRCTAFLAAVGLLTAGGCATGAGMPVPGPESIRSLESKVQASGSADARFDLAVAYHAAGRDADAASTLEPVASAGDADAAAWSLLAMSYEAQDRYGDARRAWDAYLAAGGTRRVDRKARARLALLERLELHRAVDDAITREQQLPGSPDPATVGIFPFALSGPSPDLQPLGRALAELLTTDLGVSGRLTLVERTQVQYVLDELKLAESGRVDPATAARSGRIVGAGRIVQGTINGDAAALRIEASIVPVATGTPSSPVQQSTPLNGLLDAEKQLALSLYSGLGVQLTVAERERVLQRPTDNVQALLALSLDSGFELARLWRDGSRLRQEAAEENLNDLTRLAERELGWDLAGWLRRRLIFAAVDRLIPEPDLRDPVPELFGIEGLDRRARVDVIIRPPTTGGN
jgi:tetratricopeptide (TPR) repeat protein